jgi:hypothetical protein
MATKPFHNGSGAAAKVVQAGVNAAIGLFYSRLRKHGFTPAESRRLLLKMCREAIGTAKT